MTKRNNRIDFVEFPSKSVKDLVRSRKFFSSVFGWSYTEWGDDYSDTKDSGIGTGINADPAHRPEHMLAVIYAADLEAVRTRVIEERGKLTRDIFPFPGGRRFHFKDPSGNELAVWSDK